VTAILHDYMTPEIPVLLQQRAIIQNGYVCDPRLNNPIVSQYTA